jgi:hypothetical protein
MKVCSKCKETKDDSEFYIKRSENRHYSMCKSCYNEYVVARWIKRKKDAIQYLGGECSHCGFKGHYSVFHFHHLYDKDYNWTKLRLRSWKDILTELDKCILLCANCHAIEHWDN